MTPHHRQDVPHTLPLASLQPLAGEPVEDGVLRGWTKGSFSLGDNRKETYLKGTGRGMCALNTCEDILCISPRSHLTICLWPTPLSVLPLSAVIIIHEIPNIHQKVVDFANKVVDKNFQVIMPSLVGTPGAKRTAGACISSVFKVCLSPLSCCAYLREQGVSGLCVCNCMGVSMTSIVGLRQLCACK
jgi:hypothetical protein